jgi:hypothetical protein
MSPILGILASANYPRSTNSYESIATVNLSSAGASSISFTSIPSTYQHLQLRLLLRGDSSAGFGNAVLMRFNGSSTGIYAYHTIQTLDGSTIYADYDFNRTNIVAMRMPSSFFASNIFAGGVIDILDYANTNKFKTTRTLGSFDTNGGTNTVNLSSGLWRSTAAINEITFTDDSAAGFSRYSHAALYGIKG